MNARITLLQVFFLLVGTGLVGISTYWPIAYAYKQIRWQRTEARLLDIITKENSEIAYYSLEFTDQQGRVFQIREDTDNQITEGQDDKHYVMYYNPANPEEFVMANFGRYLIALFFPFGLLLCYLGWPHRSDTKSKR